MLVKRKMDEMITHFNDVVSAMDISSKDKMTILGMITAIGYEYQKAADAIEELSREIDIDNAAMTAMDAAMPCWIPVTEALPKDEKDVLAYYGFVHDGEMSEFRFIGAVAYFAFDTPPHWQHESTGLTVTHWMPLPQPPTECRQTVTGSNQLIGDSEQLDEPVSNPYKLEELT